MDIRLGNPRVNWTKMQQMTEEAKHQGSDIVVFPELWDAGFALNQAKEFASSLSSGLFAQVAALSKSQGIFITGSMMEKRGLGVANSAPMFSPGRGIMGAYRKIHLFGLMKEDLFLTPGESPYSLDMPWGHTGIAICYDLRFPELFRKYAVSGAKMVIMPAQWPNPRREHYRTLLRARAIENGMYIVAVNRVGVDEFDEGEQTSYFGHSSIIDPWGEVVLELGGQEAVVSATIDLDEVDRARQRLPVLSDRRPDVYGNY
jgi:predicted amidohydrolase